MEKRRASFAFRRDWQKAMAAKKLADPTLEVIPLPHWVDLVDSEGVPTSDFLRLTKLFTPKLTPRPFALPDGQPTDYALSWWSLAT